MLCDARGMTGSRGRLMLSRCCCMPVLGEHLGCKNVQCAGRWFVLTCAPLSLPPAACSMPMVALNPYWLDYVEYRALWCE